MSEGNAIESFIAKTQSGGSEETAIANGEVSSEWHELAPGVQASDYLPKSSPSVPAPPPLPAIAPSCHEKTDIEDPSAEPGVCGLLNAGNTCYMNASIQIIQSLPNITQFYLSDKVPLPSLPGTQAMKGDLSEEDKEKTKNNQLAELSVGHVSARFAAVSRKVWSGKYSALHLKNFKTVFGLLHPQFEGFRQQDSQEFLAVLLDRLHEDLVNRAKEVTQMESEGDQKNVNNKPQSSSVISDTFQGLLKNEVTCCTCGHTSTKRDHFMYLSLSLPHSNEIQIDIHWSPVPRSLEGRQVHHILVTVCQMATVKDLKKALCEIVGDVFNPESLVMVYVKECAVDSQLGDNVGVLKLRKPHECQLYCFETTTAVALTTPTMSNSQDEDMDGLPAKIPRNDTTPEPMEDQSSPPPPPPAVAVVMEWHTCTICLDEMVDSDLLVHLSCGTTICSTCLQSAQQHNTATAPSGETTTNFPCPVCQKVVSSEAFTPLAMKDTSSTVVSLLQVTVLFCFKKELDDWSLCGHPAVINLPSHASGIDYHKLITCLLPSLITSFTLSFTNWKGNCCSRCDYASHCRGCPIPATPEDVALKPGDFITISIATNDVDILKQASEVIPHSSLGGRWSTSVTLSDCIELFAQKEILSSDNPWNCPKCEGYQSAERQLMVAQLPPVLIVHLKRFLFHGNTASKVGTAVSFPLTLSPSTSFPHLTSPADELHLTACVCHFGTLTSGHYTAYTLHPLTGVWNYFNDETVSQTTPSPKDEKSAYILIYQQKTGGPLSSSSLMGCVGDSVVIPSEKNELQEMDKLLRAFKPKPSPAPPPPLPHLLSTLKRSSSTGTLVELSSDTELQMALAASLGVDLPSAASVPPKVLSSSSTDLRGQQVASNDLFSKTSGKGTSLIPETDGLGINLTSVKLRTFDA